MELILKQETFKIIGCCMEVHNQLGSGFLEQVYQEALAIEFKIQGIPFEQEKMLQINYKNHKLNKHYQADFICYEKIIVETKALKELTTTHTAQIINYLKATNLQLGLLINFGEENLKHKRIIR